LLKKERSNFLLEENVWIVGWTNLAVNQTIDMNGKQNGKVVFEYHRLFFSVNVPGQGAHVFTS